MNTSNVLVISYQPLNKYYENRFIPQTEKMRNQNKFTETVGKAQREYYLISILMTRYFCTRTTRPILFVVLEQLLLPWAATNPRVRQCRGGSRINSCTRA